MTDERHELCVIGAGTAGFAAAEAARAAGRDVVLVTGDEELGGTCIRRGCMPAKALLVAAHAEGAVAKAPAVGIETGPIHVDLAALVSRKRALVDYFAQDRIAELERYPLARGDARFVAADAVVAGDRRIVADRFVVATGARTVVPPIPGLHLCRVLTSTEVLDLTALPRRIAVLGGGPIGCAFAQYFARLGVSVTLVQDGPELLRAEDPDVGAAIRAALAADGVEVICDAAAREVRSGGGAAILHVAAAEGPHAVACDAIFVAMNRRPNVASLDLTAGEIAGDDVRGIAVDATLRSPSNARVFAAGDVLGRRNLVHVAEHAGTLAARNAFAASPEPIDWDRWESHALYTDPQVAIVGLTDRACRERGIAVDRAYLPASDVGKALVSDQIEGFVKMIVRREDRRVVGVALVLADAVDLAGEAIALVDRGVTARQVAEMPHLHPTMSELFVRVAEKLC